MKNVIFFGLWALGCCVGQAQSVDLGNQLSVNSASSDFERARINAERTRIESDFFAQETACYRKFLVNRCLDVAKAKRHDVLGDLKRQEISLDSQIRFEKGADQLRKTEEKGSLANQQEKEARRIEALKDYEARLEREKRKSADRLTIQSNEKLNKNDAANRLKDNQIKVDAQTAKQEASAAEMKKFIERQEKAKERQARHDRDKLNQTNPPAKSLPLPE